jgi:predicted RNA-binding Zn ribbon-like protein
MARHEEGSKGVSLGVLDQADLAAALDFANTAEWHAGAEPGERLTSYQVAVQWARTKGILSDADAEHLVARARAHPAEEEQALKRILALREALYRIFSAIAAGSGPDHADVQVLHAELGEALVHLRLGVAPAAPLGPGEPPEPGVPEPPGAPQFAWTWTGMGDEPTSLLWPVTRSAASLLTSPQLTRVRECAGHPCGWLFLDHSKNGSRRWCDMADCGNRAKARRYRARKKEESGTGTRTGP